MGEAAGVGESVCAGEAWMVGAAEGVSGELSGAGEDKEPQAVRSKRAARLRVKMVCFTEKKYTANLLL